jgi:hypothetical protein
VVLLYVPLMKHLGMTLEEIKSTPRYQLDGLLIANGLYESIHSFDGYNSSDINQMAKDKPEVRSAYAKSLQLKEKYEKLAGLRKSKKVTSFADLLS